MLAVLFYRLLVSLQSPMSALNPIYSSHTVFIFLWQSFLDMHLQTLSILLSKVLYVFGNSRPRNLQYISYFIMVICFRYSSRTLNLRHSILLLFCWFISVPIWFIFHKGKTMVVHFHAWHMLKLYYFRKKVCFIYFDFIMIVDS
jgi:hypothetical protein